MKQDSNPKLNRAACKRSSACLKCMTVRSLRQDHAGSLSLEAALLLPLTLAVLLLFTQIIYSFSAEINLRASSAAAARELSLALCTTGLWEDMPQTAVTYLEKTAGLDLPAVLEEWMLELTASEVGGDLMLNRTMAYYEEESRWPDIGRKLVRKLEMKFDIDKQAGVIWLDLDYELNLLGISPARHIRQPAVLWHALPNIKEPVKGIPNEVWSLENYDRGLVFHHYFEGNLPNTFPVFDVYNVGRATAVVSIDLTAPSYRTSPAAVENLVRSHLNSIASYQNPGRMWKRTEYYITSEDIISRTLQLAVPINSPPELIEVIENLRTEAQARMINLRLTKAGYSKAHLEDAP